MFEEEILTLTIYIACFSESTCGLGRITTFKMDMSRNFSVFLCWTYLSSRKSSNEQSLESAGYWSE